ncbi:MAG: ADP-ribosylation factor-like protein, partial [Candidatus Hodarchaeota archaeon]
GSERHKGNPKKLDQLKEIFHNYHKSFPSETLVFKPKNANIFIFGLDKAGKTTIIRALQNKIFEEKTPPTISMDISKILIQNLQIMVYDAPGQSRFRSLWTPQLNNQHGLVFVLDVTDKERYQEAKEALQSILTHDDASSLPLMILFNKVDLLPKVKMKSILKEIANGHLKGRNYKLFPTSGLTGEGVVKSFTWLAGELTNIG